MGIDPAVFAVAALGIFVISFMKGAFGGGFAILGIPLLSLVMDPLTAGAFLAPMFIIMDLVALRYWKPSTWSAAELRWLLPALVVGIGAGFLLLSRLDGHAVAIVMAIVTLAFAGVGLRRSGPLMARPRSTPKALTAGFAAGVTTMIAHSGGPPLAMYLLPLGLPKALYAGTTSIFFTVGNLIKAGPWLALAPLSRSMLLLALACVAFVPLGVWAGWRLHQRLDQAQMTRACYALLVVTGLKLLWDGVAGYAG